MKKIKEIIQTIKLRSSIAAALFKFLWENKMWWMIPMVFFFVVFFLVIIFAQSSSLGPFIYTLF